MEFYKKGEDLMRKNYTAPEIKAVNITENIMTASGDGIQNVGANTESGWGPLITPN